MSRYPFSDGIDDYVGTLQMTEVSKESARRRLGNLGRMFHQLKTERKISSDNPARITVDDVKVFIKRRRSDGVSVSTIRRDLQYLDGYLTFHDNDAAELILTEESYRSEDASKAALDRILKIISVPDDLSDNLARDLSFVILVITLGVTPDRIRRSFLVHGLAGQSIMDYNLEFTDDEDNIHSIRLDLRRLPVLERYIRFLFCSSHLMTRTPMFPSKDPLFRFISPNDMHRIKHDVERHIGKTFDYRVCQRLFREMESLDVPGHHIRSPINRPPDVQYLNPKKGIINRIRDIL